MNIVGNCLSLSLFVTSKVALIRIICRQDVSKACVNRLQNLWLSTV